MNLTKILTRTVSFCPEVALKIGLKEAIHFHSIITRFGMDKFNKDSANTDLFDLGIMESQIDSLVKHEFLKDLDKGYFIVNKDLFMLQTGVSKNIIKQFRVFESNEFEQLLDEWNVIIKSSIGKIFSPVDLALKFQDIPYDVALQALKHSIANKNISLNFEYARKRIAESKGDERYSSGPKGGNGFRLGSGFFKPKANADTEGVSKRAISLEEG